VHDQNPPDQASGGEGNRAGWSQEAATTVQAGQQQWPTFPPGGGQQHWSGSPGADPGWQQQPPLGGYPGQEGYGPPGGQPPDGRRRNPVMIIVPLAVVAALVIGVVIAHAGKDDRKDVAAPSRASCTPVSPVAPSKPGVASIGQTVRVIGERESMSGRTLLYQADLTVHGVCLTHDRVEYVKPRGVFYVADVTIELIMIDAERITGFSPLVTGGYDFSVVTPDGRRYDGVRGAELSSNAPTTRVGQKYRSKVAIDAPAGHNILSWHPLESQAPARFQL
jgi:hypothetical protein